MWHGRARKVHMPKVVDPGQRREAIADAVLAVVAREGLSAATLRNVAAEANLAIGSVRHYFDSHDELIIFAAQELDRRISRRVRAHAEQIFANTSRSANTNRSANTDRSTNTERHGVSGRSTTNDRQPVSDRSTNIAGPVNGGLEQVPADSGGRAERRRLSEELLAEWLPLDDARHRETVLRHTFTVAARTRPELRPQADALRDTMIAIIHRVLTGARDQGGLSPDIDIDTDADIDLETARLHALLDGLSLQGLTEPRHVRKILRHHLDGLTGRHS
jgi:AcrR family transcriptional regulator